MSDIARRAREKATRAVTPKIKKKRRKNRFLVYIPWTLTTTAATANQQIGSYAVVHHRLRIRAIIIEVYLSTLSTTAALLGTLKLQIGDKDWLGPFQASNTVSGALFGIVIPFPEGIEVKNPQLIEAFCSPSSTTSTVWVVTVIGYEV